VGTKLAEAHLLKTNLSGADLRAGVYNSKTVVSDITTVVSEANLSGAILRRAKLSAVDFSASILQGADLSGADLQGADLSLDDLSGADLQGADLNGADLQGANLKGANLVGVHNLTEGQIKSATTNQMTRLPVGLKGHG
jgi:uncharacterized protein YjbI with pentapeptide repeats